MVKKPSPKETQPARFEAMLSQVLTTDEEARGHQAAKGSRSEDRQRAVSAKATFEYNRQRPPKQRKRQPKREA